MLLPLIGHKIHLAIHQDLRQTVATLNPGYGIPLYIRSHRAIHTPRSNSKMMMKSSLRVGVSKAASARVGPRCSLIMWRLTPFPIAPPFRPYPVPHVISSHSFGITSPSTSA